jgi:hypothetical protein
MSPYRFGILMGGRNVLQAPARLDGRPIGMRQ